MEMFCDQCQETAVIALKRKEVFGLNGINHLPLIYSIAWHKQKAGIGTVENDLKLFLPERRKPVC